jgi:hypothetical protein
MDGLPICIAGERGGGLQELQGGKFDVAAR